MLSLNFRDFFLDQLRATPSLTLNGRTALVLGHGAVGSRVASALAALGMDVHAVARSQRRRSDGGGGAAGVTVHGNSSNGNSGASTGGSAITRTTTTTSTSTSTSTSSSTPSKAGLREHPLRVDESLLAAAAGVVVCLQGTAETKGPLGERELRRLPRGAYLVNVGRGSVVDEGALFRALRDGHLGGAGIDEWYNYPNAMFQQKGPEVDSNLGPASKPFHELPNVVMSPHRGQSSDSKARDRIVELQTMLSSLAASGKMPNRYDLERGY